MFGNPVIHVAGIANILVDVGADANTLITPGDPSTFHHFLTYLGLTENGAQVNSREYAADVPCDDNGGSDGPATDVQFMGETAEIDLTFSKYDAGVGGMISARGYGNLSGVPMYPGVLMFAQFLFYRLVIDSPTEPLNFPCVIFRNPIEIGKGTKYSRYRLTGTAYKAPANHPMDGSGGRPNWRGLLVNADIAEHNWNIP
jgi:hypothetical protein